MSTHPFIPLYVDDYDAHTSHLTPEEDGVYGRLLRLAWRTPGCSLPNDGAWLARKLRLSAPDFQRIAQPVLDEFFRLKRGRLEQGRLKAEYDAISRKKTARQNAGKSGGMAKAAKTKENQSSNASDLPSHTRAFPEPEPYKEEIELVAEATADPKPKEAKRVYPAEFEAAYAAYPHHKGRSSKPNSLIEWKKLPADERAGLPHACAAFRPHVAEVCGGKGAPDMAVWLKAGKHLNYGGAASAPVAAAKPFPNAVIREAVMLAKDEPWTISWLDPCGYRPADKAILCPSELHAERLRNHVPALERRGAQIIVSERPTA